MPDAPFAVTFAFLQRLAEATVGLLPRGVEGIYCRMIRAAAPYADAGLVISHHQAFSQQHAPLYGTRAAATRAFTSRMTRMLKVCGCFEKFVLNAGRLALKTSPRSSC